MTNRQIVDLPLNGRGFNELARLTPGVVLLPGTGNVTRIRPEFVNGTTISGVRGRQVSYFLDGTDTSEQHQGGSWIQTSVDALQEFSVQQNAYSAEQGRSGSFFNATTKSGTNQIRGTLYEFLRNDKLDSRNFFGAKRDLLKRNQFGASVGGPVYLPKIYNGRNRTFFFANYEGMRERQGNIVSRTSPTQAMLNGDFSAIANTIYDPLTTVTGASGATRQPFPGNQIPSNRLSKQAAYFNKYLTTAAVPSGIVDFSPSTAVNEDQLTARFDQSFGDRHKAFFRYSLNDNRLSEPGSTPALGNADSGTRGQNYTASITSNLKPDPAQRIPLQYAVRRDPSLALSARHGLQQGGRHHRHGEPAALLRYRIVPRFRLVRLRGINGSSFDQRPKTQDRYTLEFIDNVTWIKGRHVVKTGLQDAALPVAGHGQQELHGQLDLQRPEHREPRQRGAHRRLVRRLGARPARQCRPRLSLRYLRRRLHVLAGFRAGRHQSVHPADAEHRTALRVHAVGDRLSRPDRHVRRDQGAADHRRQQDQPGGSGRATRRAHRIRLPEGSDTDQLARRACRTPSPIPTSARSRRASASLGGRSARRP